jgi:hypothetical protein
VEYSLPGGISGNWQVKKVSKRGGDPDLCGVFSGGIYMDPMRAYNVQWDCPRNGGDCEIKIRNQWQYQMQETKWGVQHALHTDWGITMITLDAYGYLHPESGTLYSNPFVPGENTAYIDKILIKFSTDNPNSGAECEYNFNGYDGGTDSISFEPFGF